MPIAVIALSAAILILDQISKIYISSLLSVNQSVPVIRGVFHLSLVHNTGAAFGLFKNQRFFFVALASAVIIYLLKDILLNGRHYNLFRRIALGLILGGAGGNLIDRLRLGYIVDFLDFRVWPVFNIADSALTIGIIMLGVELLCYKGKSQKSKVKTAI